MTKLEKVLYTAKAHTTGGRDGASRTSDGRLDVTLSSPGTSGTGTNPEQLFAAGYAACFHSALKLVAGQAGANVNGTEVSATVGLGTTDTGAFNISVELDVAMPNVDRATAEQLVATAHQVCPYSNATRGNVDVKLSIV